MAVNFNKLKVGKPGSEKTEEISDNILTDKEIQFILSKLRTAQYIGTEFEAFHKIYIKLSSAIKK